MCDGGEWPEFFTEKIRKAKKQHVCVECGNKIEPQEHYEYVFGVWDGKALSHKTCMFCAKVRKKIPNIMPDFENPPCYTELWEHEDAEEAAKLVSGKI